VATGVAERMCRQEGGVAKHTRRQEKGVAKKHNGGNAHSMLEEANEDASVQK